MVHGFVRQSGGVLQIDSTPGQGTQVAMMFPALAEAVSPPPAQDTPPAIEQRGGETVLAVDDSLDVLDVAVGHLQALGYKVIAAESGEQALSLLQAASPPIDLLFTDIVMPGGINGLVLAERARALRPNLPVLLATGYIEDLVAKGPPAPGMDVLSKPYRRAELATRLRMALDRQKDTA